MTPSPGPRDVDQGRNPLRQFRHDYPVAEGVAGQCVELKYVELGDGCYVQLVSALVSGQTAAEDTLMVRWVGSTQMAFPDEGEANPRKLILITDPRFRSAAFLLDPEHITQAEQLFDRIVKGTRRASEVPAAGP